MDMVRPVRMDYPGTFYHILSRGNEKREIFRDEKDYLKFLDILGTMVERFKLEVHAYVLMKNHITYSSVEDVTPIPPSLY